MELSGVGCCVRDGVPVHSAGTVTTGHPALDAEDQIPLGVYVHFPYCTTRCPYCDFAVAVRKTIPHDRYADAVIAELRSRVPRRASTLYFGGGTPGLWRVSSLRRVIDALHLDDGAEITVEINPGEANDLRGLRDAGVNRLSIGAQSFDDRSLRVLGRTHDARAARNTVKSAREAGFTNVSLDLMFALPQASREQLDRELDGLLSLGSEHLSLYALMVEPRTAFAALVRDGLMVLPDDERQAELYERVRERLEREGYVHHEISSWARPGFHARHNSLYWTQDEYVGVGASAASLRVRTIEGRLVGERRSNVRSVDAWFAGKGPTVESLDADAFEREALWLGLRLVSGLDRARHRARFGRDPLDATSWQMLMDAKLVEITPNLIRLTARGQLLADRVGAEVL